VEVDALLLHPLLLEGQPVHLRLVALGLQLAVALEREVDALLELLQLLGVPLLELVELLLHLCQLVGEEGDLLVLVLDERGQRCVLLGGDVQLEAQFLDLAVLLLDGVPEVGNHVVLLVGTAEHQVLLYLAEFPPQQLVLLPQDLILFLDAFERTLEQLGEGLVPPDAGRQLDVPVAVVARDR
jgi:hypothetical protein